MHTFYFLIIVIKHTSLLSPIACLLLIFLPCWPKSYHCSYILHFSYFLVSNLLLRPKSCLTFVCFIIVGEINCGEGFSSYSLQCLMKTYKYVISYRMSSPNCLPCWPISYHYSYILLFSYFLICSQGLNPTLLCLWGDKLWWGFSKYSLQCL